MSASAPARRIAPSLAFVGVVLAVLGATAIASPWVWFAMDAMGWTVRFSRVYNRVFEIGLVVAIALGWRRWDFGRPRDWGFAGDGWQAALGRGVLLGLAGMAVGLTLAWLGGGLVPDLRYDPAKTLRKATSGLIGAGLVAVGEEALFRGLLFRRFRMDFGPTRGIVVATGIYAVVHALRGAGVGGPITWASGWQHTAALVEPLGDAARLRSVAGLVALGALLGWARLRENIWVAVGIHSSWVAVFRVGRLLFDIRQRPVWLMGGGWPPLVGGAAGVVAVGVVALVLVWSRRENPCHRAG